MPKKSSKATSTRQTWLPLDLPLATKPRPSSTPFCTAPETPKSDRSSAVAQEKAQSSQKFLDGFPAFASLLRAVKAAVDTKGHLVGLDYRKLPIRSEHAALTTLLQSAGALICKKWVQLIDENLKSSGIDAELVAWVHDETQLRVRKGYEHDVGNRLKDCARKAGEAFSFTVPIDAEYGVGPDWSATH